MSELIDNMSKNTKSFRILLIGDSCEDHYCIGTCDRLSPEAPVPVIKIVNEYKKPGMAANVKSNFQNINSFSVDFITNKEKIKKTRYIEKRSGQHLIRVDDEPKVSSWSGEVLTIDFDNYDAIVISDYNKGFLSYEHIEEIITYSKKPVFIDTKKTDLARFNGAFIKINFLEFNSATSTPPNMKGMIVTNGDKGAMYNSKLFPAPTVEVADVCGAGDTFLAFLVYGYLINQQNIEPAIELAVRAGSISVQHRGNYAPKLSELG